MRWLLVGLFWSASGLAGEIAPGTAELLQQFYHPPAQYQNDFGKYHSPLKFFDGRPVLNAIDWSQRRQEILRTWHGIMGPWPALLERPEITVLDSTNRENLIERRVRVEVAKGETVLGYLLSPTNTGSQFPAVLSPFYEPETSVGRGKPFLDFGLQ